jgi:hypothetical protein
MSKVMLFCFRKYVQVCVQNLSELDFELSDSNLEDTGHSADLQLTPLSTQSQQVNRRPLEVSTSLSVGTRRVTWRASRLSL